jgi:hypothetical protein
MLIWYVRCTFSPATRAASYYRIEKYDYCRHAPIGGAHIGAERFMKVVDIEEAITCGGHGDAFHGEYR